MYHDGLGRVLSRGRGYGVGLSVCSCCGRYCGVVVIAIFVVVAVVVGVESVVCSVVFVVYVVVVVFHRNTIFTPRNISRVVAVWWCVHFFQIFGPCCFTSLCECWVCWAVAPIVSVSFADGTKVWA